MTDPEKRELDRWLEWAGGEVNTWTGKDGVTCHEARVRKHGLPLRRIENDRYSAIATVQIAFILNDDPNRQKKTRCSSCPQPAVEEFKVRCSDADAAKYGVNLTGTWVDTSWDGSPIREETVSLCGRCMAVEVRRFLSAAMDVAYWLKTVRVGP